MQELDISLVQALGHLQLLFSLAQESFQNGEIGLHPDGFIAEDCGWEGDKNTFIAALVKCGFIDTYTDKNTPTRLVIHDWFENSPNFIKQKYYRGKLTQSPEVIEDMKQRGTCPDVFLKHSDNQPKINDNQTNSNEALSKAKQSKAKQSFKTTSCDSNERTERDVAFAKFWDDYPKSRKRQKQKCRAAFDKISIANLPRVLEALTFDRKNDDWQDTPDRKRFIPHSNVWLNRQRWLDDFDDSEAQKSTFDASAAWSKIYRSNEKILAPLRDTGELNTISKMVIEIMQVQNPEIAEKLTQELCEGDSLMKIAKVQGNARMEQINALVKEVRGG